MTVLTFIIRPVFNFVIKSVFSVLFSSTCILWSESLRGIKVLFDYALAIRQAYLPFINIPIPSAVKDQINGIIFQRTL